MLKEIRWRALEFEYHHKSVSWYWLTAIIAIILVAVALWLGNFLFALFVIIAETLIVFWGYRKPLELEFTLDESGLAIEEKKFYPYGVLEGFAVRSGEIIFKPKNRFMSYLKIAAVPADIGRIKSFLANRLSEFEYEESLIDHLGKILRF